jgi:hypothetical protein
MAVRRGTSTKFGLQPIVTQPIKNPVSLTGLSGGQALPQQKLIQKSQTSAETGIGTGDNVIRQSTESGKGFWIGNSVFGSAPFRVTLAGALTASSATITGSITATSGSIGGWTINSTTLSAGDVTLDAGNTKITLGTGNDIVALDAADATYRLAIGNATYASAPFRVTKEGALTATSATITGSITATSGDIGGFTIASTTVSATNLTLTSGAANAANIAVGTGSNLAGMNSGNAGTDIAFWAGDTHANRASAPFTVNQQGDVVMTSATISGVLLASIGTFGGDGSDGALDTSGGTVDIDLGQEQLVVKNYTTINIATNNLTFSNPHDDGTVIALKSQGTVVISATIDASGMGAKGGVGGPANTTTPEDGDDANSGSNIVDTGTNGLKGLKGASGSAGSGGAASSIVTSATFFPNTDLKLFEKRIRLFCGSGGGGGGGGYENSGGSDTADGGAGGRGGGGLYIESLGALNFSGTVKVDGDTGSVGGAGTGTDASGSGAGGGGGAGTFIMLYNSLTANSGTVTATGGAGGAGGDSVSAGTPGYGAGGGGSGGSSFGGAGGAGGAGALSGNGTAGSAGAGAGAAGGGGGGAGTDSGSAATGGAGGAASSTNATHSIININNMFA